MEIVLYLLLLVINVIVSMLFLLVDAPLITAGTIIVLFLYLICLSKQKKVAVAIIILVMLSLSAYSILYAFMAYLFSRPSEESVKLANSLLALGFLSYAILNPILSLILFLRKGKENSR